MGAIAQNRHAVADVEDLAEPVADIDDGMALRLEALQDAHQPLDLHIREGGGGFVQNEHAGVTGKQAGDLHDLPLPDG